MNINDCVTSTGSWKIGEFAENRRVATLGRVWVGMGKWKGQAGIVCTMHSMDQD